jgi:anaerobic selenocysteine-containing dehydrogenase
LFGHDGEWIAVASPAGRVVVRCKNDDSLGRGQLALPHGYGQSYPASDGERLSNGPRVNALTDSDNCDPVARTPYHRHVVVRLERLAVTEAAACEERSRRIHAA